MSTEQRTYHSEIKKLATLETFDPEAFASDERDAIDVADFMLALALAFNDFKDLLLGHWLLLGQEPVDVTTPTPELGAFGGMHLHMYRLMLGFLHELLVLLKENLYVRSIPAFTKVEKQLSSKARNAWKKLVAAVEADKSTDNDVRFLLLARNKVAFHYDRKVIGRSFRRAFPAGGSANPYVSRGASVSSSRFYFADAAAQAYLREVFGRPDVEHYLLQRQDFFVSVGQALHALVTTFVVSRGFAWRKGAV